MKEIRVILVAGARPNFMKIAPLLRALEDHPDRFRAALVHTGQHYDNSMSETYFRGLEIRPPDHNLEVGSGTHAEQTAQIMLRFEPICRAERPDLVIVVGDVNSTIAAGLVAKKLGVGLAHVEAGLRSGDRTMPEEINRIATDSISDLFFTTEADGTANLLAEGHPADAVHFVGNVMIDNLLHQLSRQEGRATPPFAAGLRRVLPRRYVCLTLHRPSNVDDPETLSRLIRAIDAIAEGTVVLFPCHPRTRERLVEFDLIGSFHSLPGTDGQDAILANGMYLVDPLGYDDFLQLWKEAALVITDSGGLQEETTALQVPCVTVRETTERPVTVELGSNIVVGTNGTEIRRRATQALNGQWKPSQVPPRWDGKASQRIVQVIRNAYGGAGPVP